MFRSKRIFLICAISALVFGCLSRGLAQDVTTKLVFSRDDPLLGKYDRSNRLYKRTEDKRLDLVSYFHRRQIGEAIVEKDFIRYMFDAKTGKLVEETKRIRTGLPDLVAPSFPREQAEAMVKGQVTASRLYFISPRSQVFCIKPTPNNPCWIVWSKEGERVIITIIDAMTGQFLGHGTPPPYRGFAFYCDEEDAWKKYRDNADKWFEKMGYSTKRSKDPCSDTVKRWIQSDDIAMFYEISHGGWDVLHMSCSDCDVLSYMDVEAWFDKYASMPFAYLSSCDSMCYQTRDTFSYEFRKGSEEDAVVVGFCGLSESPCAQDCLPDKFDWQDEFFSLMNAGWPVGNAFFRANLAYPDCAVCSRIAGEMLLVFAGPGNPKVKRSISGEMFDKATIAGFVSPIHGVPSRMGYRATYVRSDIRIPFSRRLTLSPRASTPIMDLLFMNDSKIHCAGELHADGSQGELSLVSVKDKQKGMKIKGKLRARNGGKIKIYQ